MMLMSREIFLANLTMLGWTCQGTIAKHRWIKGNSSITVEQTFAEYYADDSDMFEEGTQVNFSPQALKFINNSGE